MYSYEVLIMTLSRVRLVDDVQICHFFCWNPLLKNCAKEESSVGCGDLLAMKIIVGVSLLVFLFVAVRVQGERVIRAAEHAEKTGRYIVKLRSGTSREVFEQTLKNALFFSDDSIVYTKNERAFKFFVLKLSEESINKVCMMHTVHP